MIMLSIIFLSWNGIAIRLKSGEVALMWHGIISINHRAVSPPSHSHSSTQTRKRKTHRLFLRHLLTRVNQPGVPRLFGPEWAGKLVTQQCNRQQTPTTWLYWLHIKTSSPPVCQLLPSRCRGFTMDGRRTQMELLNYFSTSVSLSKMATSTTVYCGVCALGWPMVDP